MNKKAEMGVGTLIVFIAMLLVAAVAAGVLIQTISSLQSKSLMTGQQAESQISTAALTVEVSATDGRTGYLNYFNQRMKLAPGSDAIKLDQVIFTFNTNDATASLKYRGTDGVCENNNQNGYNTFTVETLGQLTNNTAYTLNDDLNDDGLDDTILFNDTTNVIFYVTISGVGVATVTSGADISAASTTPVPLNVNDLAITYDGTTYGYLTAGTTNVNDTVIANITTVEPADLGEGYFTVVYEQRATDWVAGNLQRGDIIKLCYEAPSNIGSDEEIRLSFIPKIGSATLTEIVTPEVISSERAYLYP